MKKSISFILLFLIIFSFCSCSFNSYNSLETSEIFVMNTYVSQKVYGKNNLKAISKVNSTLKELESKLSLYVDGSSIDKINKNAGVTFVKVDSFTYDLIEKSLEYCKLSDGMFDITIAPLTKLWGITTENPKVPTNEEISKSQELVDYHKVILNKADKSIMLKENNMEIDLGGIAKGYVCKVVKDIYNQFNIKSALISIGGNVYVHGKKPNESLFSLGIRDPLGNANDIVGKIDVKDKVVATTGGYERFFEKDGEVFHHILDIKTGFPVKNDILSVTIISDDGGLSDFLSTALFIAGKEKINKYLNHDKFSIIVIDSEKNIYISNNLKNNFKLTNNNYVVCEDLK